MNQKWYDFVILTKFNHLICCLWWSVTFQLTFASTGHHIIEGATQHVALFCNALTVSADTFQRQYCDSKCQKWPSSGLFMMNTVTGDGIKPQNLFVWHLWLDRGHLISFILKADSFQWKIAAEKYTFNHYKDGAWFKKTEWCTKIHAFLHLT